MSIQVRLHHATQYSYDRPVILGPHVLRLRPTSHGRTQISNYSLKVADLDCFLHWQTDSIGNRLARLVVPQEVERLEIEVEFEASLNPVNVFDFFIDDEAVQYPFRYSERANLLPYLRLAERGPRFFELVHATETKSNTVEFLVAQNQAVMNSVTYTTREEVGVQTCEETLLSGQGSCRDIAWLLIQVLRQLGFAARFVSGYLIQLKTQDENEPNPVELDVADYHAWTEVYLPGAGWIGLDPTSGMLAGEGHIPVAFGPNPEHAAAVSGTHSEAQQFFEHRLSIERIAKGTRQHSVIEHQSHPPAPSGRVNRSTSATAFG